jgi:hypothetical protein
VPGLLGSLGQPLMDTSEVRWFAHGPLPEDVVAWFARQSAITAVEERSDTYLLRGLDGLGVKYRNQRVLEVKWCHTADTNLELGHGLRAPVLRWLKWRPAELDAAWSAPDTGRVDVHKVVLTSSFALIDGSVVPHALPSIASIPACKIELATVEVGDVAAWTLGLEASGPVEDRRRMLLDSWRFMAVDGLPSHNGFARRFDVSAAYPDWLERQQPNRLAG